MINKEKKSSFLFVLVPMIFISLILQIVHLPASISDYRPDILVLVLIFFSMNSHFTLKLETAWLIGKIGRAHV